MTHAHLTPIRQLARRLPGRRALITGGAGTLGLALATELAFAGWQVGLIDRNAARLAELEHEFRIAGLRLWAIDVDVRSQAEVDLAVSAFCRDFGGLDLFINSAGNAAAGAFETVPDAHWQNVWNTQFMGAVHGARAALPYLQAQKGVLLNIASAAAIISSPQMGPYNAAKAALLSLSETLAGEYAGRVQVAVALPGFFRSGLLTSFTGPIDLRQDAENLSLHSSYTAEQAAADIFSGLARGEFYLLPRGAARIAWWFKRLLPETFLRQLPRRRAALVQRLRERQQLLASLPLSADRNTHPA